MIQANHNETVITEPSPIRVLGADLGTFSCRLCGATRFRKIEVSGRIVHGEFVEEEVMYECIGCHKPVSQERVNRYFEAPQVNPSN